MSVLTPELPTLERATALLEAAGIREARAWWIEPELEGAGFAVGLTRTLVGRTHAMTAHVVQAKPGVVRLAGFEPGWPVRPQ